MRASIVAVLVSAVVGVAVILPAETGTDPTGFGGWIGLTVLAQVEEEPAAPVEVGYAFRADTITVTLEPGEGTEVKTVMREGDQLLYSWNADAGPVFFDFHGEPEGRPSSEFTSFEKGTLGAVEGTFEAPFSGTHGWYWKNTNEVRVSVTVETSGVYASIGQK